MGGQTILLHFGAVDYECEIFLDGELAGRHRGGSSSFSIDISAFVTPGQRRNLVVRVKDDLRARAQTGGKQSQRFASKGCFYTRTTGIWQTVWLEAAHPRGLQRVQMLPDIEQGCFTIIPEYYAAQTGNTLHIDVRNQDAVVATAQCAASNGMPCRVDIPQPTLWEPGRPHLYDLTFTVVENGAVVDTVRSYGGLRKVHIEGNRVFLNNTPFYQRLVLDQGFYPDGIWTAPSDEALKRDIQLAMEAGFNGARLHQKVFEERFHYWAATGSLSRLSAIRSAGILPAFYSDGHGETDPVKVVNTLNRAIYKNVLRKNQ